METKMLIDLAYNYNLAKSYDKSLFCPMAMPTPLALPGSIRASSYKADNAEEQKKAVIREELIYRSQEAYRIPNALKLSLSQVVTIQRTSKWQDFIRFQRNLFDNPLTWNPDVIRQYSTALSDLYSKIEKDYKDFPFIEKLYSGVSILIKIGIHIPGLPEFIGINNKEQMILVIEAISRLMDMKRDSVVRGMVEVKHFLFNSEGKTIEEFTTIMSEVNLTDVDLDKLKNNYLSVDLTSNSPNENEITK